MALPLRGRQMPGRRRLGRVGKARRTRDQRRRSGAVSGGGRRGPASYSGRPFVSSASGPSATAPSVCAVAAGGSTQSVRGSGGTSGRRTIANWLSARTTSSPARPGSGRGAGGRSRRSRPSCAPRRGRSRARAARSSATLDAGQLVLDQELAHELVVASDAARDHVRPTNRAVGAEGVEIADVGLVLDDVQPGEGAAGTAIGDRERAVSGDVDREHVGRRRRRTPAGATRSRRARRACCVRPLDETPTAIRQRVDERRAVAERFARDRRRSSARAARSGRACRGGPRRTSSRRSSRADGSGAGRARRAGSRRAGTARPSRRRAERRRSVSASSSRRSARSLACLRYSRAELTPRRTFWSRLPTSSPSNAGELVRRRLDSPSSGRSAPTRRGAARAPLHNSGSSGCTGRWSEPLQSRTVSHAGSLERCAEAVRRSARSDAARRRPTRVGEVVVVRQELAGDAPRCPRRASGRAARRARRRARARRGTSAARTREELRQLRRMAEAVGRVAGAASARPPKRRQTRAAEQQVANERLAADQQLVGEHVPRPDLEPAGREQRAQPGLVVGSHVEVVLEHDRLPVERERHERVVAFEHVEHLVERLAETQPESLERQVPLTVPVRVRHDEETKAHLAIRRLPSRAIARDQRVRRRVVRVELVGARRAPARCACASALPSSTPHWSNELMPQIDALREDACARRARRARRAARGVSRSAMSTFDGPVAGEGAVRHEPLGRALGRDLLGASCRTRAPRPARSTFATRRSWWSPSGLRLRAKHDEVAGDRARVPWWISW